MEGCCHGELTKIYAQLARMERERGDKVDLLIICGDFQAVRHQQDLQSLACPPKYRQMGDFREYYEGRLAAPVPTLFIGGNHEASSHLWGLYHGGWACKNIYFLGYSGVIRFGGVRIGGISGIFNERHYDVGYYERPPYDSQSMRSIYHYRRFETFKLAQVRRPLDVFLSHEWPTGIYQYGDLPRLLALKPYFRAEVARNELGAKPLEELLFRLRPAHWFSAHLHVHFEAVVPHPGTAAQPSSSTRFLALDKCLPRRTFLQIVEVEAPQGARMQFEYDPEWLGIVRASDAHMNLARTATALPAELAPEELALPDMRVPLNFRATPGNPQEQTDAFCRLLGIPNRSAAPAGRPPVPAPPANPDEIKLDF